MLLSHRSNLLSSSYTHTYSLDTEHRANKDGKNLSGLSAPILPVFNIDSIFCCYSARERKRSGKKSSRCEENTRKIYFHFANQYILCQHLLVRQPDWLSESILFIPRIITKFLVCQLRLMLHTVANLDLVARHPFLLFAQIENFCIDIRFNTHRWWRRWQNRWNYLIVWSDVTVYVRELVYGLRPINQQKTQMHQGARSICSI